MNRVLLFIVFAAVSYCYGTVYGGDQPQWAQWGSRNMVSAEVGIATDFDPDSGEGIKWKAMLGGRGYSTPVVAGGKVLIGANNVDPRDERHDGDRGVLLCLNEADGTLCWQLVVPRISDDKYKDWPLISICSPPTVEGDRVYVVTNRYEVVCLDLKGQANGNDGPYMDEGRHMAPADEESMEVTKIDADIIWLFDMIKEVGMYPHDGAHASILMDGKYLYLNTGNGVDNTHAVLRCPDAPTLIVLDKQTGKLVAKDNEGIGHRIFHATWSSPSMGQVNGSKQIFLGGPDGICYGFEALEQNAEFKGVKDLERVWKFDCDPEAPKENISQYLKNRQVSPSNIKSLPVFYKDRLYVTVGGDVWWGKEEAWLKCIDATKTGDITNTGQIWSYDLEMHVAPSPTIVNGLVFVGDSGYNLHCVDAETGKGYWKHEFRKDIWGTALAVDGKIYVGSRRGDLCIFAAEKEKKLINTIQFDSPIASTAVAANGVLYIATMKYLYAID
jgi:outer membrane protein assembly factor BamB